MELFTLIHGSAHNTGLPDASVQCCVTSPPYWGLRKYAGDQGVEWPAVDYAPMPGLPPLHINAMRCELGLEPTPEAYIGHMVLVMRELRRVLRNDGVAFVNLGDSYASATKGSGGPSAKQLSNAGSRYEMSQRLTHGVKEKDLIGIPWRFAFAAQADGWWLRSDIVWAKPNPMPESVTDRPTKSHEYVFLLTKSARYYWDADAVKEESHTPAGKTWEERKKMPPGKNGGVVWRNDVSQVYAGTLGDGNGRNMRDVWTLATQKTSFAHFATYPEALVEPCILAGTSARGCCPECGAPWQRVVKQTGEWRAQHDRPAKHNGEIYRTNPGGGLKGPNTTTETTTTGWRPTCDCWEYLDPDPETGSPDDIQPLEPMPCVVLDPFHGSGTTGVVALRLGRAYVGVDISEDYLHGVTQERMGDGVQVGLGI